MTLQDQIAQIDAQIADCTRRSHESWERSDTDGFLSQWANDLGARKLMNQKRILMNGGVDTFIGLYTLEGERVPAKLERVSHPRGWGHQLVWHLTAQAADVYGRMFIPQGEKSRIQKKLGLQECEETAPAESFIDGEGRGLSGSAWVASRRTGDEWGRDSKKI